jgi:hypothetical protein
MLHLNRIFSLVFKINGISILFILISVSDNGIDKIAFALNLM